MGSFENRESIDLVLDFYREAITQTVWNGVRRFLFDNTTAFSYFADIIVELKDVFDGLRMVACVESDFFDGHELILANWKDEYLFFDNKSEVHVGMMNMSDVCIMFDDCGAEKEYALLNNREVIQL